MDGQEVIEGSLEYGIAYQNSYSGGFYYGDLINSNDGYLPKCFPEDEECQIVSAERDSVTRWYVVGIITVIGLVIGLFYCYKNLRKS